MCVRPPRPLSWPGDRNCPRDVAEGVLAEIWQPAVQEAAPLSAHLQTSDNGPFLGQRFCSPCAYSQAGWADGWVQQVPASAEVPNRSCMCSCPHITSLVLGTGPAAPAAPSHPGEMLLLFLKHLLKAAAFFFSFSL